MDDILKIKNQELNIKLSEINQLQLALDNLEQQEQDILLTLENLNKNLTSFEEYLSSLVAYQKLNKELSYIRNKIRELKSQIDNLREEAKIIITDIKSIEIIKHNRYMEHIKKEFYKEELDNAFFYNLKHFYVIIFLCLAFSIKSFGAPALYNDANQIMNQNINQEAGNLNQMLDKKLQELKKQKQELKQLIKKQEELKKLEAKKQQEEKQKKEQQNKEIEKYIKVVASADSDQAGAMLDDVDPEIAAKILTMLPSRKAGNILSAMKPSKAALVTQYIMAHKKELNQMKQQIMKENSQAPQTPPTSSSQTPVPPQTP